MQLCRRICPFFKVDQTIHEVPQFFHSFKGFGNFVQSGAHPPINGRHGKNGAATPPDDADAMAARLGFLTKCPGPGYWRLPFRKLVLRTVSCDLLVLSRTEHGTS
jgi:hypothetical protein